MIKEILNTYFDNELDKVLDYSIDETGVLVQFINASIDLGRRNLVIKNTIAYDVDNDVCIDARNFDSISKNIEIRYRMGKSDLCKSITPNQYLDLREYLIKKLKG